MDVQLSSLSSPTHSLKSIDHITAHAHLVPANTTASSSDLRNFPQPPDCTPCRCCCWGSVKRGYVSNELIQIKSIQFSSMQYSLFLPPAPPLNQNTPETKTSPLPQPPQSNPSPQQIHIKPSSNPHQIHIDPHQTPINHPLPPVTSHP